MKQLSRRTFILACLQLQGGGRAGRQAAASFQPAGSSGQDKASLFKTPPTPQRKWESSPCCLTRSPLTTHTLTQMITDWQAHMRVQTGHTTTHAHTCTNTCRPTHISLPLQLPIFSIRIFICRIYHVINFSVLQQWLHSKNRKRLY